MRVLIIAGTFHPEIGGPPRYLNAFARELVAHGHDVQVLCMSPRGLEVDDGDYPFPVHRISRGLPVPLRLARMMSAILRLGRRADVWFVSDYGLPAALASFLVRRPMLIKIVGDFAWEWARRHGRSDADFDAFQREPQRGRVRMVQRLQRFYVGRCDRVLVPSEYLAGVVSGWGVARERITVIHNAIDGDRFALPESPGEARARHGLPARYVLSIARLAPWKGIDALIEALPGLPEDLHLVVAGDGPERQALLQRAVALDVSARVHLLGDVPGEQIGDLLAGAQALALYTGYEGLSHVLLEALAAGTAIVASDKGGNLEVVEDGENGLLVPYGDQAALVAALARVASDDALRAGLQAGARAACARFSWPVLVERTIALLQEVAAGGGDPG